MIILLYLLLVRHVALQNQIIFSWKKTQTAATLITQISSLVTI